MDIIPVILSGGSGTRLWPLSRKECPKQYLPLVGDKTTFQESMLRLEGLDNLTDPIIICNNDHRFLVAEQCQQIDEKNPTILLEPIGRDTASAITAAAFQSIKSLDDAVLLVLPADHIIQNSKAFHDAISIATKQAKNGKLVTFGIVPTDANTGYGYIKSFKEDVDGAYNVDEFVEKPDLKIAKSYLEQGNYLWNSGMFMFKASTLIDEMNIQSPGIVSAVKRATDKAEKDLDFIRLDEQAFNSSPSGSIDYVLMEKSDKVMVVPLDAGWSDIGSWNALYDIGDKDSNGNVIKGDVIAQDTVNTYIDARCHMVATIGLQDLIIIDTHDVTLIGSKDKAQEIKNIVGLLRLSSRTEIEKHRKVYRPWGWYDSIEKKEGFQVKRIHVNPGGKLSLQSHKYRSEHWVIINGEAVVTKGTDVFSLKENQSTYISIGEQHSLENTSKQDCLELIEVQSGSYLGEDDIIRYDDIYNRHLSKENN
jgi:mannose-1-phosphate guanylyltransferase/mannose-6-phosphate isomerase